MNIRQPDDYTVEDHHIYELEKENKELREALKYIKRNLINELNEPARQSFWRAVKALGELNETNTKPTSGS